MKRVISLILSLAMVFSFATTAFATDVKGSITIKDAQVGETYTIWKMFDVETYVDDDGDVAGDVEDDDKNDADKVVYTVDTTSVWYTFAAAAKDKNGVNLFLFTDTTDDTPTLKYVTVNPAATAADWAQFAKDAVAYAVENDITETRKIEDTDKPVPGAKNTKDIVFDNLELGYYVIDSTVGILCALDTTEPDVEFKEKNTPPDIDKYVQEDSIVGETDEFRKDNPETADVNEGQNDADINQAVEYVTVVTVKDGAYNYAVHDKMTDGLTFDPTSVKVYLLDKATPKTKAEYDAMTTELVAVANYDVTEGGCAWPNTTGETCTFDVKFKDAYMKELGTDDYLHVVYSATLNENAKQGEAELNDTYLTYGNNSLTTIKETETYTFKFNLAKVDGTVGDETAKELLDGAEFRLYYSKKDGDKVVIDTTKEIKLAYDEEKDTYYPLPADTQEEGVVIKAGTATITGLDSDTYFLKETKQPTGYNKLKSPVEVVINKANRVEGTTYYLEYNPEATDNATGTAAFVIVNNPGAELPSTGGMGTTLFYIVGAALVLGSAVVFVTKKRIGEAE